MEFDVVHAEYSPMGQYFTGQSLTCGKRTVHVLDLLAPQMRRRAAHLPFSRRKLEYWIDGVLAPRYEALLCSCFDVVFACAPRIRKELLRARPGLNVVYLPPGVDACHAPKEHVGPGKHLVFVGAMWREENIDAVLWFYQQVFPLIRAQVPDVTLTIVGGNPAEPVRSLAADPGVRVTGYVPQLSPYYAASDVSIAPVRIAGGVLCKVLDAMGAGLPVVTTSFGNDGVGAQPEREILIGESPEEFAGQAVRLLKSPDLRRQLGLSGRNFINLNFSATSILSRFEAALLN
jgi:glycosyltransferase involved in cell wall biosynthesis